MNVPGKIPACDLSSATVADTLALGIFRKAKQRLRVEKNLKIYKKKSLGVLLKRGVPTRISTQFELFCLIRKGYDHLKLTAVSLVYLFTYTIHIPDVNVIMFELRNFIQKFNLIF